MSKMQSVVSIMTSRKASVAVGIAIIFIVIIDLLTTRQILPYTNDTEAMIFILTIVIGYGFGSWILLSFTKRISEDIRAKSHFINLMHWTVTSIQYALLGMLLVVLFSSTTWPLSPLVLAISSIVASIIMTVISIKFFSWYGLSNFKNFTILCYAVAAILLATSIAQEGVSKLLLIEVVNEPTPPGATIQSTFLYEPSDKYNGEIEYKVVGPHTTTLYILPSSNQALYVGLASTVIPIAFVFRWLASTTLLRSFHQTVGKLPPSLWIILSLPLVFYLVGKMPGFFSGESFLGVDEEYRYYFKLLFRIGNVAGNILFGFAFFMVARRMTSPKLKDYLIIAAIGDTIVGLALSTSGLQQTYGIAGHSLLLLSSYLFSIGLYLSAIALSQDSSLRKSIKRSAVRLIDDIGSAQMEQQIEGRVKKLVREQQKELEEQTGGFSDDVSENELKEYMELVIEETKPILDSRNLEK
jgi:hypothetical protein